MLIPFGVFSAAGAGGGASAGTFDLISSTILTGSQASVTFDTSTLSSTYKHLQLRIAARSTRADDNNAQFALRFNSDSGANYTQHRLLGTGSSVLGQAYTGLTRIGVGHLPTPYSDASAIFSGTVIDILDAFSTSKNTTVRSFNGDMAVVTYVSLNSGLWINTAAITSVNLTDTSGSNFATGSRFSIYGIKG